MIESVLKTIKENKMFNRGDKVIVAVSGGPDSICLLHILYVLQKKLGITLYAAHLNHCLRGEEADADEEYVKKFCENLNIQFRSKRVNVEKIAKERNLSCESAGREIRYEFFEEFRKEIEAEKVALAHNANDQAETILMRIMRGTGLDGLVGIRAVRDSIFIRPIINNTRDEIEKYCEDNQLNPRIDKTNLETIYARNKVRLELIPYIQQNFNKDIIKVLNRFSDTIKMENDYLSVLSQEKFKKYCDINKEKVIISKEAFLEHESVITRIIRLSLQSIVGNLNNFEKVHISDIIHIQKQSTGKELKLPKDVYILNDYGDIIIRKNINKHIKVTNEEYVLYNGYNEIPNIKSKIHMTLSHGKKNVRYFGDEFIQYFDYDKIKGKITLRYRSEGDRFTPLGMNGSKKLKNLFIDLKISKEKRDTIPLICFGGEIGWIVGYRVSELFKVDKNTKSILAIKFESEEL